jgi:hypothetical protein
MNRLLLAGVAALAFALAAVSAGSAIGMIAPLVIDTAILVAAAL